MTVGIDLDCLTAIASRISHASRAGPSAGVNLAGLAKLPNAAVKPTAGASYADDAHPCTSLHPHDRTISGTFRATPTLLGQRRFDDALLGMTASRRRGIATPRAGKRLLMAEAISEGLGRQP